MILYASAIFLGAFLLFLVQPIIAKQILPWFGGSAAVWTTCLVFFQMALLAGYAYADFTTRHLSHRKQVILHLALLAVSLLVLPITPDVSWKPGGEDNPSWRILGLLTLTIGLPYFILSTTSPLLQSWFARSFHHAIPYRLFALSNLASLLALLAYPFLVEPWVTTRMQSIAWSVFYGLFVCLCGYAAIASMRVTGAEASTETAAAAPEAPPKLGTQLIWMTLAATATFLLLAVTTHITQNVASLPFLWILPLSLYLATFILCFDHPRWYRRGVFLVLVAALVPLMAWYSDSLNLKLVIPMYLLGLFVCCMFCHGELAHSKPAPRHLTRYYLMISVGGAVGGLLDESELADQDLAEMAVDPPDQLRCTLSVERLFRAGDRADRLRLFVALSYLQAGVVVVDWCSRGGRRDGLGFRQIHSAPVRGFASDDA